MTDRTEAEIRNAALEEAAEIVSGAIGRGSKISEDIRALKSAPAAVDSAKGADVALPPLPDLQFKMFYRSDVLAELEAYARAAVLADRQRRGGDVSTHAYREALQAALDYGCMTGDDWVIDKVRAALAAQPAASATPDGKCFAADGRTSTYTAPGLPIMVAARDFNDLWYSTQAQTAASAEPSDALSENEWYDLAQRHATRDWNGNGYMAAIQAVCLDFLSHYGRPAGDAQPVAWVAADTLHSPHPRCVSSLAYMSQIDQERGREYVPLYAAPVAAQKADDARDAERYRLIRDLGASFRDYEDREYSVCEGAMDSALDSIRAAIAQQRKGEGGGNGN